MQANHCKTGFSLIELLVVIAVITILSALLLPTLWRGPEKARCAQCLNNFRQMGVGFACHANDDHDRFPSSEVRDVDHESKRVQLAIGGTNPEPALASVEPSASVRPLNSYLKNPQSFHCPKDHGMYMPVAAFGLNRIFATPTCWQTLGCSYIYNDDRPPAHGTLLPPESPTGLAGKTTDWVPNPCLYVLMYEPPAGSLACPFGLKQFATDYEYQFWHYSGPGNANVERHNLPQSRRFWSPLLFVDGHAKFFDFTRAIDATAKFNCEPTADWIWYKPALTDTNGPVMFD